MPALKDESKLWVAYPKLTSKIVTDLNRSGCFAKLNDAGYESAEQVSLDHVWHAVQFVKLEVEETFEIAEPVVVKKKMAKA
jgi:hypothetical protein